MIPVCIGVGLAFIAMAATLAVVAVVPLSSFPTIAYACATNGMTGEICLGQALTVGVQSVAAYALVLAAGFAICRLLAVRGGRHDGNAIARLHPAATTALLLIAFGVLLGHMVALGIGPVHASRGDESEYFANFISVENLLWPLLLQLYVTESDQRLRLMLLGALAAVMAFTPYRAVLLAIFIFGFAVPLAVALWQAMRAGWPKDGLARLAVRGALASVIGLIATWGAYVDTTTRAPSLMAAEHARRAEAAPATTAERSAGIALLQPDPSVPPPRVSVPRTPEEQPQVIARPVAVDPAQPAPAAPAPLPPTDLRDRVLQRVAFPLYQAAIAGHLAVTMQLPTIADEIARKFRLSDAPTLEEFLFRRIFGGTGKGQTTSLYYSEAAAYFPGPAIVWMVLGPLCIGAAGLVLRRRGIDAGTMFGVGMWRSSFSGLIPVLPALGLQALGLIVLTRVSRFSADGNRWRRIPLTAMLAVLATVLGAALVLQCWALVQKPARSAVLIADFSIEDGCVLVSPTWVPIRVNQVFAQHHLSVSSALISAGRNAATIGVPYGGQSAPLVAEMAIGIATLVRCSQADVADPVVATSTQLLERPPNPLDHLSALGTVVALLACLGAILRVRPLHLGNMVRDAAGVPHATPWRDVAAALTARLQFLAEFEDALWPAHRVALLAALVGAFFLLAALSLLSGTAAAAACALLVLGATVLLPRSGLLLVVACVPVQAVFGLSRAQAQIVLAVGLIGVTLRHVHLVRRLLTGTMPTALVILAAFVVVVAARTLLQLPYLPADQLFGAAREGTFHATVAITALAAYAYAGDPRFRIGLMQSFALALTLTILLDAIAVFLPDWNAALALINGWPGVRFAGLHVNPNATAKYLLLATALACGLFWAARTPGARAAALAALAAATLALGATLSKSALLGMLGALLAYLSFAAWHREWRLSRSILTAIALILAMLATWQIAIFPSAIQSAMQRYAELHQIVKVPPRTAAPSGSVLARLEREFRIDESYAMRISRPAPDSPPNSEMYRNVPGNITYTRRDCGWTCAGQRDRLWRAAAAVVRDHWLLGIGADQWPREFEARLSFPFDSPHNALLELWGGYGLAGLVLYGLLVRHLLRMVGKAFRCSPRAADSVLPIAASLYVVAILLTELFDPAKFLAVSPHSIWLWILIAAVSRTLETSEPAPATVSTGRAWGLAAPVPSGAPA